MASTVQQFIDRLLKSITNFYTATYSSDTNIYQILNMFSREFHSGSLSLDQVRNNAFIVTASTSEALTNNFGEFANNQRRFFDQNTIEDRYVDVESTFLYSVPSASAVTTPSGSFFESWVERASAYSIGDGVKTATSIIQFKDKVYFQAQYPISPVSAPNSITS